VPTQVLMIVCLSGSEMLLNAELSN
jgi:hypothetical protein